MNIFHNKFVFLVFCLVIGVTKVISQEYVSDYHGNKYRTIKIGDQIWMAKNLNVTHYSNGKEIVSFCYDNDTAYCSKYGRLYTWGSLNIENATDSMPGICPTNWHVPSDAEWDVMLDTIGGFRNGGNILRRGKYSDFNLRWGGNYQSELKIFSFIDKKVYFWSSSTFSSSASWMRMTGSNMKNVNRSTAPKEYAFSIRCVKD